MKCLRSVPVLAFFVALFVTLFAWVAPAGAAPFAKIDGGEESLLASSREVPLALPQGVSLAGYGNLERRQFPFPPHPPFPVAKWFKPSKGTLSPLHARAFLLERPNRRRLLFLSLELIAVNAAFRNDVAMRLAPLGFATEDVHVFATHTHSGPAGVSDTLFWQVAATDRFQPELYESLVAQSVVLVEEALATLEPASLVSALVPTQSLQVNRRVGSDPVESGARLLLARRSSGSFLGGLLNYAMHGTALRPTSLLLSPDAPGVLADVAEQVLWEKAGTRGERPVVLFLPGVGGDVNPNRFGLTGLDTLRTSFKRQLGTRLDTPAAPLVPVGGRWDVKKSTLDLGPARISARNCVVGSGLEFLGRLLPKLDVSGSFPRHVSASSIAFEGDPATGAPPLSIALWPGEPTTKLGRPLLGRDTWLVSLADDFLAYFTTPEEHAAGGYEACLNLYGPQGGTRVADAIRALLAEP